MVASAAAAAAVPTVNQSVRETFFMRSPAIAIQVGNESEIGWQTTAARQKWEAAVMEGGSQQTCHNLFSHESNGKFIPPGRHVSHRHTRTGLKLSAFFCFVLFFLQPTYAPKHKLPSGKQWQ